MAACFSDNQPMDLEKLLSAGANPNAQNIHSNTALMMVVSTIKRSCLHAVTDINIKYIEGITAFMLTMIKQLRFY